MNDRPYRTAAEVALELGVSLRTVRRWVADGRLLEDRVVGGAVEAGGDGAGEVDAAGLLDGEARAGRIDLAARRRQRAHGPRWPGWEDRGSVDTSGKGVG